jgi:hypothetical protein
MAKVPSFSGQVLFDLNLIEKHSLPSYTQRMWVLYSCQPVEDRSATLIQVGFSGLIIGIQVTP